jgi:hypothetical protein
VETFNNVVKFTVKEGPTGQPFLAAELMEGDGLPAKGELFLRLNDGVTIEQAAEIAKYLNRHVPRIGYMIEV